MATGRLIKALKLEIHQMTEKEKIGSWI